MPNIKSQIKRVKTNEKANAKNSSELAAMRTVVKKANAAIAAGDKAAATAAVNEAFSVLDKAAQSHIISDNACGHRKARLAKALAVLK